MTRAVRTGFLALVAVLFTVGTSSAHIIPPEDLHPVAVSYRNSNFLLNQNPVAWDQVWVEMDVIARHLESVASERGRAFRQELSRARAVAQPFSKDGEEFDPVLAREQGRRAVFTAATRAVSSFVLTHLEGVIGASERRVVTDHLNQGRRGFESFTFCLEHADPIAWNRLSSAWLDALTHLGNDGVLGAGARPMDHDAICNQILPVVEYVKANFLQYEAGEETMLWPRPKASPTHQPSALVPNTLPPGAQINKQVPRPRQILGMAARGVDESETTLIALGDMAFDSAYILGDPARALQITCNTCHNKGTINPRFFIPGLSKRPGSFDVTNSFFAGHANDGVHNPIDIPDLRGIRFTAPYGRDGRFSSLRDFLRNGIVHEFNGTEPDPLVLDGLIAYMNQFEFLPNPALGREGKLVDGKASEAAFRGEKIFHRPFTGLMGGKSCASCHIPSDHFLDRRRHDLGTAEGTEPHSLDRALDTPTLLGVKFTAPYFHDGRLATLGLVVDWFNAEFALRLSDSEARDLTVYLETIGDGVEPYEKTSYYLDAEMEEFVFFLSTYRYLRQQGKHALVGTTFRTIAAEITNHKWELQDPSYRPVLEKMASLMEEAYSLNRAGRYAEVERLVDAYRRLYRDNVEHLR